MKRTVYLDYAAATPVDPKVLAAMQPYFTASFYNPSALYLAAQSVARDIADARIRVASILGSKPAEVIFTAGGTEANNLAIHGVMSQYPNANIVISSIEHESVRVPAAQYDCREVGVAPDGRLDMKELEKQVDEHTVLVSVMYANNEIGTIQPIREVTKLTEKLRAQRLKSGNKLPLLVHTDACQAGNYLDLHVHRHGVDMMTLNGGKIYGPKQSGVLYKNAQVSLQPQIRGGGQEQNLRSGTENVPAIVGFAKALELVQARREDEAKRLTKLRDDFIAAALKVMPQAIINGSLKARLPNNVHLTIPGMDNERLMMSLDEHGVMCATGSACSASKEESSHVLKALGLSDEDARASLRFTLGQHTSLADINYAVKALQNTLD